MSEDEDGYISHEPVECLSCGMRIEGATQITSGGGDLAGVPVVCWDCGEINIYCRINGRTQLREPTIAELTEINHYFGPILAEIHVIRQHCADRCSDE